MSMINDALKRAKELEQQTPPPGAPPLPHFESRAGSGAGWMLALAAILFIAAICLVVGVVFFKRINKAPEISAPVAQSVPASNAAPPMPSTNPPPAAPVEQPLQLQGIIFNAAHPLAIVNGKAVGVGDRVNGFQVKQILQSSIVLQRSDGSPETLKLGK